MSWTLAALVILALALAAGFQWYERTRPDARIVALVATLAAFAALGRIAFAAVPNVKPTSDIVLISGYALGGAPGFAVGAIGGLASNFFFGQGPWTPWQMAAWGVTGMIGAAIALLYRRRGPIGRWPLALACGVCGFAFTAVQDAADWLMYSGHGLTQLGVYVGQGLGFDAIYAASCVGFALAFGPALLRAIQRFTRRLEVSWLPGGSSVLPGAIVAIVAGLGLTASMPDRAQAADRALQRPVAYLLHAQNADGGFGAEADQPSGALFSGWAALGLEAAGVRLSSVARGPGVVAYVQRGAGASDPGSIERNILVARAAGLDPSDFGGRDLVAALRAKFRHNGSLAGQVNLTAFGILAMRAAGQPPPASSYEWLLAQSNRDGGFGFDGRGSPSDVDDTGAVLEALAGVGGRRADSVRRHAVAYIRGRQDRDGGLPSQPGDGSNAQSTAWAIQGLDAARVNPATLHRTGARSPLRYLQSLIGSNGAIAYARGEQQTPVWVTGEALMALAGKPLPLSPLPAPPAAPRTGHPRSTPAPASRKPAHRRAGESASTSSSTTTSPSASAPTGHGGGGASPHRSGRARAAGRASAVSGGTLALVDAAAATATSTVAALGQLM